MRTSRCPRSTPERSGELGFSLLELLLAASLLLVAVSASLASVISSDRLVQHSEQLSGVINVERIAQSYLRSLSFTDLQNATESTLTSGIDAQLTPFDWSQLGATGSVGVTHLILAGRLVTLDLQISYGSDQVATTSMRVAQWGLNP